MSNYEKEHPVDEALNGYLEAAGIPTKPISGRQIPGIEADAKVLEEREGYTLLTHDKKDVIGDTNTRGDK